MTLIRWKPRTRMDPFADMMGMKDEINRLFDITLGRSAFDHPGLSTANGRPRSTCTRTTTRSS